MLSIAGLSSTLTLGGGCTLGGGGSGKQGSRVLTGSGNEIGRGIGDSGSGGFGLPEAVGVGAGGGGTAKLGILGKPGMGRLGGGIEN